MPAQKKIKPEDLVIHFLNVGFGDNIVLEFPEDNGVRRYGLVDCFDGGKTLRYLRALQHIPAGSSQKVRLKFVCATHPHYDHVKGIREVIESSVCEAFWDSGFRHTSKTYRQILEAVDKAKIRMVRVSSGMEWYLGRVRLTALAPSVLLRNRYATYGVDINNASIVLRIEHGRENVVLAESAEYRKEAEDAAVRKLGTSVVILAGDAEFDSWSHICQEYPQAERFSEQTPSVKKLVNHLSSALIKVAHHGSMHSTPLDVYEKMKPEKAIISTLQETSTRESKLAASGEVTRYLFPHEATVVTLEESDIDVFTTDGSYEAGKVQIGVPRNPKYDWPGTIVAVVPPGGRIRWDKFPNEADADMTPPSAV
jgi:beta-lactamase superfamily II metal-dependent hydrolase